MIIYEHEGKQLQVIMQNMIFKNVGCEFLVSVSVNGFERRVVIRVNQDTGFQAEMQPMVFLKSIIAKAKELVLRDYTGDKSITIPVNRIDDRYFANVKLEVDDGKSGRG